MVLHIKSHGPGFQITGNSIDKVLIFANYEDFLKV